MKNIFKKQRQDVHKMQEADVITVEEIHETFFTEVDRLLDNAKVFNSLDTDKQALLDKCERLTKLGFSKSKEVQEATVEINRLNNLKIENEEKKELIDAINYFSQKYPLYKFITEESVKKICEKYGLIYGEISNYIGTIPDKNLKEIEDFKISEDDEAYTVNSTFMTEWGSFNEKPVFMTFKNTQSINETKYYRYSIEKSKLVIAAPISDFDTKKMKIENHQLIKVPVQDPIVLKPVIYNEKKYFLIMSAWGEEASDENVVNQNFN